MTQLPPCWRQVEPPEMRCTIAFSALLGSAASRARSHGYSRIAVDCTLTGVFFFAYFSRTPTGRGFSLWIKLNRRCEMKTATLIVIGLMLSSVSWAQGGPDACSFAVSLKNTGCYGASGGGCSASYGCTSTTFTVPCDDQYTWAVSTSCSGGYDCDNCYACSEISHSGGSFGWCSTSEECSGGDCTDACGAILHPGITYTLTVCLLACEDFPCDSCGNNCMAVGCVYLNSVCPAP